MTAVHGDVQVGGLGLRGQAGGRTTTLDVDHCFDGWSGVVQLDLGALGDLLDILSTSLDNVELLDVIRAEVGDDPEVWMPIFKSRLLERRGQR